MLLEKVQKKFALTKLGAENLIKACISCTISYIVIAMSIGVLYFFTCDMLKLLADKSYTFSVGVYIAEFVVVFALIYIAHYIQYNMTFLNTYTESARLRINVAEKLRKFPMSFFSKRDLSDLTTTILSDVTYMEQALSHFIPEFVGSIASTVLLSIGMFVFDFKMALAAVWCVPVSIILILLAKKKSSNRGGSNETAKTDRDKLVGSIAFDDACAHSGKCIDTHAKHSICRGHNFGYDLCSQQFQIVGLCGTRRGVGRANGL